MNLNVGTGKMEMSFDDLRAVAIIYQTAKLEVLPTIENEARREVVERGLNIMRDFWVERKMEIAPFDYHGTADPIKWLNT